MQPNELISSRFLLQEVVGRGGMGVVWAALDQETSQRVALKELSLVDSSARTRFAQEAWLLSQLSHPNIVRHIAHGETPDGQLYLVMEWLQGEDAAARLIRGPLSDEEARRLVEQLAAALSHAHSKGVIHRDIKPSNLFLLKDNTLKVVDFGIARYSELSYDMTRTGVMIGTPGYMAPEQASRGAKGLSASADIFAVGCILFEALTGKRAFAGENALAILSKILLHHPPRLEELGITSSLSGLIERMLSKEPSERPQNGSELLSLLGDLTTPAAHKPSTHTLTLQERRYFALLLLARPSSLTLIDSDANAPTIASETQSMMDVLLSRVSLFHGKLTQLIEGSFLISFEGTGSATDLATQAARCALSLRELTASPISLSFGRAELVKQVFVGEAIDRAASLLEGAKQEIVIDPVAASLLESKFILQPHGEAALLLQERASPKARTLLGKAGPCVGRDRELTLLEATFRHCVEEDVTKTIVVVAPAGVGKSRLREEFLYRIRDEEHLLLQCHGDALRAGSPFSLLVEALRRYFSLKTTDSQEEAQQKVLAVLQERLPGKLSSLCPLFLGELLGLRFSDKSCVELRNARNDAAMLGDLMRRYFLEWLYAERSRQPLLFLIEDLHWGDPPTVSFLESARRISSEGPLMILATARPEVQQVFGNFWDGKEEVRLSELTKKASERLIRATLGDSLSNATMQRMLSISGGNAFYLEELIRAVSQGKDAEFPETVLAMASARLEELSPEERRVLRAASIFGQRSSMQALSALVSEPSLSEVLASLCEGEVFVMREEGRFAGQREYSFRHALLREAVYTTLTQQDKTLGHRLAAEWLEENQETDKRALAGHWEMGAVQEKAVLNYVRAAEQALEGNDLKGVLFCTNRAIECGASGEHLARAHWIAAEALNWQGEFQQAMESAQKAVTLCEKGELWFRAAGEMALAAGRMGQVQMLAALAEEASSFSWSAPLSVSQILFVTRVAAPWLFQRVGRRGESLGLLDKVLPFIIPEELELSGLAWREILLASWDFLHSRPAAWHTRLAKAAELFERAGDQRNTCTNLSDSAFILGVFGDVESSIAAAEKALQIAERLQTARVTAMCLSTLGASLSIAGRYAESVPYLQKAALHFREQRDLSMHSRALITLGRTYSELGDLSSAWRVLEDAPKISTTTSEFQQATLSADLYLREGQTAKALEVLTPLMSLTFSPWIELSFGDYHRTLYVDALCRLGRRDEARAMSLDVRRRIMSFVDSVQDDHLRSCLLRRREYVYALRLAAQLEHPL
jgi:serine/threonine protein kinase/tetratricopeptide (TPR) repeat protein